MKKRFKLLLTTFLLAFQGMAQNIPVGFPVLNDYLRREQILGNLNSDFSFIYKPILTEKAFPEFSNPYLNDSILGYQLDKNSVLKNKKFAVSLLPIQMISMYNTDHPYNWGHGAILPAKGFQTLISGGLHLKWGKLSAQLYPQFHYAQNLKFEEYPENAPNEYFQYLRRSLNGIDQPVRFGQDPITRILPGNSNISLNLGGIALGVSTENIWIGPGQNNSLLMTDNAEGFLHFKLNTTRPLKTFAGNFEGNYWIGKLEGSNFPHFSDGSYNELLSKKEDDWRYFTGLSISYSPIFLPNLYLGATRAFQVYRGDMRNNFRAFFPFFAPLPKEGEGILENVELREDQNVGIFGRYLVPKANFEFYFEYSRNDHPFNWRDLILNIEHSRGYLLGFSKYIKLNDQNTIGIIGEMTQTKFSINNTIRWGEGIDNGLGLYDNYQVKHGFTYKGENLGAGTGVSGNEYSLKIGHFQRFKEVSLELERLERHPNYYYFAIGKGLNVEKWVDYNFSLNYKNTFNRLVLSSSITSMVVKNYNHWNNTGSEVLSGSPDKRFNMNLMINLAYLF
ncbi:hypothetical protein PBT90_10735 [Algoriphagus halophytocola]|uniref:capsule assembly Wzi family protein n=1 Tax=Algoriphagus halophytocola TaxID=2991499 RepID=UPI0022DDD7B6|nr:capsule assembly Wzi family protein [Algoriphagus sp. TR-M9]WBL41231.1 hypothetical protein PBT90_10735 [Algoriphagus sp. TR-M9]